MTAHFDFLHHFLNPNSPENFQFHPSKIIMSFFLVVDTKYGYFSHFSTFPPRHRQPFLTAHFRSSLHILCATAHSNSGGSRGGANPVMAPHRSWQWSLAPLGGRKRNDSIVYLSKSKILAPPLSTSATDLAPPYGKRPHIKTLKRSKGRF